MLRTLLLIALGAGLGATELPNIGSSATDVQAEFGVPLGNARARTSGRVVWSYQGFLAVIEDDRVVNVIELTTPAQSASVADAGAEKNPSTKTAAVPSAVQSLIATLSKTGKVQALDPSTLLQAAAKAAKTNTKNGGSKSGRGQGQGPGQAQGQGGSPNGLRMGNVPQGVSPGANPFGTR